MTRTLLILALTLGLAGCGAKGPVQPELQVAADQTLAPPPPDKAQVVFLEPINKIQGLFMFGIYDITGDATTRIATTWHHTKTVALLAPGQHRLMSGAGGHVMEANVEAGKRYYVLVRFIYAQGFQLRPLRNDGPTDYTVNNKDFPGWMKGTTLKDPSPESDAFLDFYKDNVVQTRAAGLKRWEGKSPEERAELTLDPADAVAF